MITQNVLKKFAQFEVNTKYFDIKADESDSEEFREHLKKEEKNTMKRGYLFLSLRT